MTEATVAHAYIYLSAGEVRFLNAAVERLIPTDDLGAGGRDAGVTVFIDGQLASTWGSHGRNYRMGPWREGTPQQGYQSPLTPQEIYRAAIREIDNHCRKQFNKIFAALSGDQQDELLRAMEAGKRELESIPSKVFFGLLLRNTMEGYFADPMYGGNRDKVGWRMLGFPGIADVHYQDRSRMHDVPYRVEPVSILDIETKRVSVDAQGYAKHVKLNTNVKGGGNGGH